MKEKSVKSNPVSAYLSSAWSEFGKVTWPTKEQAALLTAITVVLSLLIAALIGVLDLGFTELYQLLLNAL